MCLIFHFLKNKSKIHKDKQMVFENLNLFENSPQEQG